MDDSLRRDDMRTPTAPRTARVLRMKWAILNRSGYATQTLYTFAQAHRFVRLAKRWGHDVYTARFGKVRVAS